MLQITGNDLIDLIPQKPPFVLISELHEVSEHHCITSFMVHKTHVLYNVESLSAPALLENIAQTCAVKVGYECSLVNKKVPLGFIGDIKAFSYTRLPKHGEVLNTEITIEHQIFDVTLIAGKICIDGEEIASCKMKIFVEPEKAETAQLYASEG